MGFFRLLLATVLSCFLCLSVVPVTSFGASASSDVKVEKKAKVAKKDTRVSASRKTKDIPRNIDINTADKKLLMKLPGIGPKTADNIIAYRKTNGKFSSISDLTKVKGIGKKTLAKISPYLKNV